MNRHAVIAAVASAIIAAPFAYAASNIAAAESARLAWDGPDGFGYYDFSNSGRLKVCNSLPVPAYFGSAEARIYQSSTYLGAVSGGPLSVPASGSAVSEGRFSSGTYTEAQYLFFHMDAQLSGTSPPRIDLESVLIESDIEASILGLVPYHAVKKYDGSEFYAMMSEPGC